MTWPQSYMRQFKARILCVRGRVHWTRETPSHRNKHGRLCKRSKATLCRIRGRHWCSGWEEQLSATVCVIPREAHMCICYWCRCLCRAARHRALVFEWEEQGDWAWARSVELNTVSYLCRQVTECIFSQCDPGLAAAAAPFLLTIFYHFIEFRNIILRPKNNIAALRPVQIRS